MEVDWEGIWMLKRCGPWWGDHGEKRIKRFNQGHTIIRFIYLRIHSGIKTELEEGKAGGMESCQKAVI